MTVSFFKTGPGQSARLALQVLGKNGSIFNPNNIRYIPVDSIGLTAGPPCELLTGLAGVNLAVSVGTLALSAATFLSVQKLHKKMDTALSMLGDIKAQLDEITARTRRIDVAVAEDRLRQAMKHVFRNAIHEDGIDLTELIMFKNDLQNLFDTLQDGTFLNFLISLSTDVRDNLYYLYSLLFNLRHTIAWHHNRATNGDPSRTITITQTSDYIDGLTMMIDKTIVLHKMEYFYNDMWKGICDQYSWHIPDDKVNRFDKIYNKYYSDIVFEDTLYIPKLSHYLTELEATESKVSNKMDKGENKLIPIIIGGLIAPPLLWPLLLPTLKKLTQKNESEKKLPDNRDKLIGIVKLWIEGSDSGLMYRTFKELQGLEEGYQKVFWKSLPAIETPLQDIKICHEFSTSE